MCSMFSHSLAMKRTKMCIIKADDHCYICRLDGYISVNLALKVSLYNSIITLRSTSHQQRLRDPSSFHLIVCLFYQMDSGQHHNIYVRVHSSTGLSCMYL